MTVSLSFSALRRTRWYEFGGRFFFGGAITVVAGVLAGRYGPVTGGLFLAFPAIFPAGITLIEKQERKKKQNAGMPEGVRGRKAAALDARGAAIGSLALALFGWVAWKLLPRWNASIALAAALLIWLSAAMILWIGRRKLRGKLKAEHHERRHPLGT